MTHSQKFTCGRRHDPFRQHRPENEGQDEYRGDDSCTYCGSLNPETLMARLEAGTVKIHPTDKNYKIYVENDGGEPFRQTYRTDSKPFVPWDSLEHDWVTRETSQTKFYFQHLSEAQMRRFIELLNQKRVKFTHPGYFYVRPYFIAPPRPATEAS